MTSSRCVLLVIALVFSAAHGQVVSYNFESFDASNQANFQYNLDAPRFNNPPPGALVLTQNQGNQAGTIFLKNSVSLQGPNGFKASFSTRFAFSMASGAGYDGSGNGADGIVFAVTSASNTGGSYGGGIGYSGILKSVGIEFDSWYNPDFGDVDGNHIGIDINGQITSVQQLSYPNLLNNGQIYYAWVDFNGDTSVLEVRISTTQTRPATPFMSRVMDLVSILGTPTVYVGFTAATGGSVEYHRIHSWSFTNQYAPNAVCGNGAIELGEACDGGACCTSACRFATSAVTCRASAGVCDAAETCSGNSATCPADSFASSSVTCRASAGPCDVAETCTGTSTSCPADSLASSSVTCRASVGPCDVAETCSGSDTSCPADSFASSSVTCRAANGDCDVAETCSGSSAACPADAFASSSVTCRAANGDCDVAETCSGSSSSCPADGFSSSSTVCRASAGDCDVAESCSGSSASCPADSFQSSSVTCRASAGNCDVAEQCSGSSASCPADSFQSSSVTCRASAGDCDVAEQCSGSSASCPADAFASSSVTCRAAAGACDVAETCSGSSVTCPADAYAPSSRVCRPAANSCDIKETCSGNSTSCPADALSMTGPCWCGRQGVTEPKQYPDYFCTSTSNQFYMCVYGVYLPQSRLMTCGKGTSCGCSAGTECSCGATTSPCVMTGQTQTC